MRHADSGKDQSDAKEDGIVHSVRLEEDHAL